MKMLAGFEVFTNGNRNYYICLFSRLYFGITYSSNQTQQEFSPCYLESH